MREASYLLIDVKTRALGGPLMAPSLIDAGGLLRSGGGEWADGSGETRRAHIIVTGRDGTGRDRHTHSYGSRDSTALYCSAGRLTSRAEAPLSTSNLCYCVCVNLPQSHAIRSEICIYALNFAGAATATDSKSNRIDRLESISGARLQYTRRKH